jgi:hypothetical protein
MKKEINSQENDHHDADEDETYDEKSSPLSKS